VKSLEERGCARRDRERGERGVCWEGVIPRQEFRSDYGTAGGDTIGGSGRLRLPEKRPGVETRKRNKRKKTVKKVNSILPAFPSTKPFLIGGDVSSFVRKWV